MAESGKTLYHVKLSAASGRNAVSLTESYSWESNKYNDTAGPFLVGALDAAVVVAIKGTDEVKYNAKLRMFTPSKTTLRPISCA